MSKKVLVNLNLNKNQIENAAAHNLSSAPSSPVVGQEYFNTSDKQKYIWNGTAWVSETAQGTTYSEGTGIDITGNVISASGLNLPNCLIRFLIFKITSKIITSNSISIIHRGSWKKGCFCLCCSLK